MKNKKSLIFILLGLLLLCCAAGLVAYNLHREKQGGIAKDEVLEQLMPMIPEVKEFIVLSDADPEEPVTEQVFPDYVLNPDMEMPIVEVYPWFYIGTLEIPELDITLPINSEWSYPALLVAPCRYYGSAYKHNLVIAAHNYDTHFGQLPKLSEGSLIILTDMDGNEFRYEVVETEILQPTAIKKMRSGDWDLTLFTCTIGGRTRFTVRCQLIPEA